MLVMWARLTASVAFLAVVYGLIAPGRSLHSAASKFGVDRHIHRMKFTSSTRRRAASTTIKSSEVNSGVEEYKSSVVDGFFSMVNGLANLQVIKSLSSKPSMSSIVILTDNVQFARKRSVTPQSVYSGLLDKVRYEMVESRTSEQYQVAIQGAELFVAHGVSVPELSSVASSICASETIKRAVLAVCVDDDQHGTAEVAAAASQLSSREVQYTIFRYRSVVERPEAVLPYRVVRDGQPLPVGRSGPGGAVPQLSTGDLFRVLGEVVDLPKTYNQVYGIGPGNALDAEILTYMKSRGWSERIQVGMLVGDMMEVIERKVEAENQKTQAQREETRRVQASTAAALVGTGPGAVQSVVRGAIRSDGAAGSLPKEGEGNKLAGFFV